MIEVCLVFCIDPLFFVEKVCAFFARKRNRLVLRVGDDAASCFDREDMAREVSLAVRGVLVELQTLFRGWCRAVSRGDTTSDEAIDSLTASVAFLADEAKLKRAVVDAVTRVWSTRLDSFQMTALLALNAFGDRRFARAGQLIAVDVRLWLSLAALLTVVVAVSTVVVSVRTSHATPLWIDVIELGLAAIVLKSAAIGWQRSHIGLLVIGSQCDLKLFNMCLAQLH